MASWQPTTSKCGKDTLTSDLSVSQHTSSAAGVVSCFCNFAGIMIGAFHHIRGFCADPEWSSLPHDILSQLLLLYKQGLLSLPDSQQHFYAGFAKAGVSLGCFLSARLRLLSHDTPCWLALFLSLVKLPVNLSGECPTKWRTCPENAPFRPQRSAHLAHLTLEKQLFGSAEALMISQLPSLRSLCLKQPATFGALSVFVAAPKGYTLPAPCMLTHLTSLSLI